MLERIDIWVDQLDSLLNTRKKRHMMGGVLISMSALLSGIAITIMTIKE